MLLLITRVLLKILHFPTVKKGGEGTGFIFDKPRLVNVKYLGKIKNCFSCAIKLFTRELPLRGFLSLDRLSGVRCNKVEGCSQAQTRRPSHWVRSGQDLLLLGGCHFRQPAVKTHPFGLWLSLFPCSGDYRRPGQSSMASLSIRQGNIQLVLWCRWS